MRWTMLAAALLVAAAPMCAQTIWLIVPFAPGGVDVVARILAEQLRTAERTFVVENHAAPVRAALERDFLQAMQAPPVVERLAPFGLRNPGNAAQFRARLEKDQQEWGALIRKLGIKGE